MKCPKCGKEIANDSLFCEYCGTKTGNDERRIKKVDIRWCLLPAMIIATIAMGFASESSAILFWDQPKYVELIFVIPLCLFVVSCWYGIKKVIPPSFVIMIGILFGINCYILYRSENPRDVFHYAISSQYGYEIRDNYYRYLYKEGIDEERVKNELLRYANTIEEGRNGEDDYFKNDDIYKVHHYLSFDNGPVCVIWALFLPFIYLFYTYIAHRKGWKF